MNTSTTLDVNAFFRLPKDDQAAVMAWLERHFAGVATETRSVMWNGEQVTVDAINFDARKSGVDYDLCGYSVTTDQLEPFPVVL